MRAWSSPNPLQAIALACIAACLPAAAVQASEIEGVEFAMQHDRGGERLRLHGLGLLRYRIVIKGYVAALYLGEGIAPERALGDVPRRLEIEYFWPISADAFREITSDGIAKSAGRESQRRFRGSIERLNALYRDVEPGDRYSLTYLPGLGTELALNDVPLGVVDGEKFSSALFSIWLGEKALDESLRSQLLAGR